MIELLEEISSLDFLRGLSPEELGGKLLFFIRARKIGSHVHTGRFRPVELSQEFINDPKFAEELQFESQKFEILMVFSEAWGWLEAQGLIVDDPTTDSPGFKRLTRRARGFENDQQFADYIAARLLPKEILHPSISSSVWLSFMRGEFATAVFEAMRAVEIAVRSAANFAQGEHGVPMIRKAFHKENGPLTDKNSEDAEREALSSLFAGAIGSYKNPHSHRNVPLDNPREAAEIILLASHLLQIVDAREKQSSSQ